MTHAPGTSGAQASPAPYETTAGSADSGPASAHACCGACTRPLTDELTGLLDRRAWEDEALQVLSRARQTRESVAVIMADLDRFKGINDTYGHPAGDAVLRAVADVLDRIEGGVAGRYGGRTGDEFLVLLPGAGVDEAVAVARRAQELVRSLAVTAQANRSTTVTITGRTVSMGVTACVPAEPAPACLPGLLLDSDVALREAKRAGGDRIRTAGSELRTGHQRAVEEPYIGPCAGGGEVRVPLAAYGGYTRHNATELVLTPAAAEHLHSVLAQLLGRSHADSPSLR